MIDPSKLKDADFSHALEELENQFVSELENMIYDELMSKEKVVVGEKESDVLEFSGRTNFKIRVKRPNKNVWSVPVQLLRETIRKVLREGRISDENGAYAKSKSGKASHLEVPLRLLLRILPPEEYEKRSFVGNLVEHSVYGEGVIQRITETGNVEIQFKEKVALLKPGFFKLKLS